MNIPLLPADLLRRLSRVAVAILLLLATGTVGYMSLEGWRFLDALYMTVITISTVGFTEVRPLDAPGRVFTILIIMSGTGVMAFLLGTILEYVVGGELTGALRRHRVQLAIDQLTGHYVVCGFGRVGQEVVAELLERGLQIVVIDRTIPQEGILPRHFVTGDAADDAVLRRAGVTRARGLVAVTGDDNANIVVALTARALNAGLVIVARASAPSAEPKLLRAGANHVISPYRIGGRRIATQLLHPQVTDFLDRVMHSRDLEFWLEEHVVAAGGRLAGRSVAEAAISRETGVNVLAVVKQGGGPLLTNPAPEARFEAGDIVIGFGTRDQLARLSALAGEGGASP